MTHDPASPSTPSDIGSTGTGSGTGTPAPTPAAPSTGGGHGDLVGRVVQGAHQTIDRLAGTAASHVHRVQDGVANAGEVLHSRADLARETGQEWTESLRCTVRENPLAAVATAVAVGMLIARLTRH